MTKSIFTLTLFLLSQVSYAQFGIGGLKAVEEVMERETWFILEDDFEEYNETLTNIAEKYWTLTPFKVKTIAELSPELLKRGDKINFIKLVKEGQYFGQEFKEFIYNDFKLALFLGEKKKVSGEYDYRDIVSYTNIIHKQLANKLNELAAKSTDKNNLLSSDATATLFKELLLTDNALEGELTRSIQLIQHYCTSIKQANIKKDPRSLKIIEHYNSQKTKLKNKTLLISKDDIQSKKIFDVADSYPYKIKIVEQSEIWKAIIEQQSDIAYFQLFYEYKNTMMKAIVCAEGGKVIYGETNGAGNGLQ